MVRPSGAGQITPLYLFVFKNAASLEAADDAVTGCRQRWMQRAGIDFTSDWAVSPYRAFAQEQKEVVADAIEAALRDAAVSGSGGG